MQTFAPMWKRFGLYGLLGWVVEVVFTGTHAVLVQKDRSATAHSYLWMFPIYGLGGLTLELTHHALRRRSLVTRGLAGMLTIYALEYASGRALRRALGKCPWDYGNQGLNVHGLVRLDYAPFWFGLSLASIPLGKTWGAPTLRPQA